MVKDYYYLLGLPRYAPLAEVKQAYRRLAAQYHPDRVAVLGPEAQQEATAKMTELNEAIAILSDPHRCAEYHQLLELIPERKPKPVRHARPTPKPSAPPSSPPPSPEGQSAAAASPRTSPHASAAAPAAPAAEPSRAEPQPSAAPSGLLVEEHVNKLKSALKALPMKWKELRVRGWKWGLEAADLRRSILVVHRHLENLSLLSARSLGAACESLLNERKRSLRCTAIIALVSYDRLMDARAVPEQLQALVAGDHGWLKNVHPLVVLYDGRTHRATLIGAPGDDPEVQRVVRLLLAGR